MATSSSTITAPWASVGDHSLKRHQLWAFLPLFEAFGYLIPGWSTLRRSWRSGKGSWNMRNRKLSQRMQRTAFTNCRKTSGFPQQRRLRRCCPTRCWAASRRWTSASSAFQTHGRASLPPLGRKDELSAFQLKVKGLFLNLSPWKPTDTNCLLWQADVVVARSFSEGLVRSS